MISKRAVLVSPRKFEIRQEEVCPGPNEVLVKVASCGLCNWELNHWRGHLGTIPQTLGHEWGGTIVELGSEVKGFAVGDVVTGLPPYLNGFAEYATYGTDRCVKLNPDVNPVHALGEPLKCIVTNLRAAAPEAGDYGVVLGCGPMGLWCVQGLAGNLLAGLIAVDIDDKKLELARKFGATHTINSRNTDVKQAVYEITNGRMADFSIEGTGNPRLVSVAMSCLRTGRGRLVLMSSYEAEDAPFNLKMAMEKSIEVRVGHYFNCLDQTDEIRRAATLINNGTFKMDGVISHVFRLDEIQKAFETLENKPGDFLKGIVIP